MPRYKPAQTTAWRSWESPTEHRTLLLNQQQREFLLLEDVSSRLWQQVCEMAVAEAEAAARPGLRSRCTGLSLMNCTKRALSHQLPQKCHHPYLPFLFIV